MMDCRTLSRATTVGLMFPLPNHTTIMNRVEKRNPMSLKTLAYALAIMAIEVAASLSQTVAAEPARPKPPIIIKK